MSAAPPATPPTTSSSSHGAVQAHVWYMAGTPLEACTFDSLFFCRRCVGIVPPEQVNEQLVGLVCDRCCKVVPLNDMAHFRSRCGACLLCPVCDTVLVKAQRPSDEYVLSCQCCRWNSAMIGARGTDAALVVKEVLSKEAQFPGTVLVNAMLKHLGTVREALQRERRARRRMNLLRVRTRTGAEMLHEFAPLPTLPGALLSWASNSIRAGTSELVADALASTSAVSSSAGSSTATASAQAASARVRATSVATTGATSASSGGSNAASKPHSPTVLARAQSTDSIGPGDLASSLVIGLNLGAAAIGLPPAAAVAGAGGAGASVGPVGHASALAFLYERETVPASGSDARDLDQRLADMYQSASRTVSFPRRAPLRARRKKTCRKCGQLLAFPDLQSSRFKVLNCAFLVLPRITVLHVPPAMPAGSTQRVVLFFTWFGTFDVDLIVSRLAPETIQAVRESPGVLGDHKAGIVSLLDAASGGFLDARFSLKTYDELEFDKLPLIASDVIQSAKSGTVVWQQAFRAALVVEAPVVQDNALTLCLNVRVHTLMSDESVSYAIPVIVSIRR